MAHFTTHTTTVAIIGNGMVECGCHAAPVCLPNEPDECQHMESHGFSAGFAGFLEAAVTAVAAYFGLH